MEIVGGDSRSPRLRSSIAGCGFSFAGLSGVGLVGIAQREDFERYTELGFAKRRGFFLRKSAEFARTLFNLGGGNMIRHLRGSGARPHRIREDVEIGERSALDEIGCGAVIFGGFAGEAGDDVGTEGRVGQAVVDELDATGVVFGAVPAVHTG